MFVKNSNCLYADIAVYWQVPKKMSAYTIADIMRKIPKTKNGEALNNTEKRKIGAEKLAVIQYKKEYNEAEKNAIVALKTALAKNSMKSYQQLKLYSNEIENIKTDLVSLARAIDEAVENDVLDDTLKVYLTA